MRFFNDGYFALRHMFLIILFKTKISEDIFFNITKAPYLNLHISDYL